MLIRDMPSIMLFASGRTYVVSERASSYVPDPFNKSNYATVELSE